MLLKTFFIILAAFLVYYFGFYPDSEKTISGEQTTQNPQLWNAKKINFQISLGDNQYRLQAKKIEALNEEKYRFNSKSATSYCGFCCCLIVKYFSSTSLFFLNFFIRKFSKHY